MTPAELETYLRGELDAFPGRAALLMAEAESGRVLHAADPDVQVVSASTIKVPILCAALELCRRGELSLSQLVPIPEDRICPDTSVFEEGNRQEAGYPLWELLYWMIVLSDNTATNAVIRLLGYDVVNGWCRAHGLERTRLEREMLDWDAIAAGRNNYTSAADQFALYRKLCRGEILNPSLTAVALDMLRRQRSMDDILRYNPYPVDFAHKTGGLDYLSHDAGVFFQPGGDWFLGIFTWDGPSAEGDDRQKQFIGRLGKAIYDTYGAPAPAFCTGG